MAQSARVQDPSMEEILASIRRIIADEGGTAEAPKPDALRPAAAQGAAPKPASGMNQTDHEAMRADKGKQAAMEADVLELTETVETVETVEPAIPAGFRPVTGADVMFRESDQRAVSPRAPAPVQKAIPAMNDELLSPTTTTAVSTAFGTLATTILAENARTLEDLVKEMMRPMLKEWLDENLPGLVERMVRAEIERVSRGGR